MNSVVSKKHLDVVKEPPTVNVGILEKIGHDVQGIINHPGPYVNDDRTPWSVYREVAPPHIVTIHNIGRHVAAIDAVKKFVEAPLLAEITRLQEELDRTKK